MIMKRKKFTVPKVKKQILSTFFLAAILPILILGSFALFHVRNQMKEHYQSQLNADAVRVNSILFDITTSVYTSSQNIANRDSYIQLLGSDYTSDVCQQYYQDLTEAIAAYHQNSASVSSIHIYTDNPYIPENDYISYVSDYKDTNWFASIDGKWSNWTCLSREDRFQHEIYELSLIRRIGTSSSKYTAYLVIRLDNNNLKNRIDQTDYQILASVDSQPIFFATDNTYMEQNMPLPDDFSGEYYKYNGPTIQKNQKVLTTIQTFHPYRTDNYFLIHVSDFQAYKSINSITLLYFIILLVAILIPAGIIFVFSSYFSNRINVLKSAMHQTRTGDYNIIETFQGDDELTETFQDLKATVEMIHEKEAHFYQAQIKEQQLVNRQQQMEFEMLASQINPHFLYNTLETIRMQALANGNRDVATSIKLLGKSMHYVLENTGTSFTTLTKELDYIKTYLTIQKLRFNDRVNAQFLIPEDLNTDDYRILPLLLQPVVENAITHGLELVSEHGCITISVHADDDLLTISIADNGCGMTEEELNNLLYQIEHHKRDDTRSIGLYNINQRIHLFYGMDYGIRIDSHPQQGTTVTITLPASQMIQE